LEGFDDRDGTFTVPETAFYDVNVSCTYVINVEPDAEIDGSSTTKLISFLPYGQQSVVPYSTTNTWTTYASEIGNFESSGIITAKLPLIKGEKVSLTVYQENGADVPAVIHLDWTIVYDKPYHLQTSYVTRGMQDHVPLRCQQGANVVPPPNTVTFDQNVLQQDYQAYEEDYGQDYEMFLAEMEQQAPTKTKTSSSSKRKKSEKKVTFADEGPSIAPSTEPKSRGWFGAIVDYFQSLDEFLQPPHKEDEVKETKTTPKAKETKGKEPQTSKSKRRITPTPESKPKRRITPTPESKPKRRITPTPAIVPIAEPEPLPVKSPKKRMRESRLGFGLV
jgi:hypothetical protein